MSTTSAGPTAVPLLRAAASTDLPAIGRLLADAGLPDAGVATILGERPADFTVAEVRGADGAASLVGVAGLETCGDDALLRSVAVRPEWRTRGLGRELVRHVVEAAEARGLRALYLLTTTAERYFPRFGFAPVERASVPADVAATEEFRSACPASAVAMARPLRAAADVAGA